MKKSSGRTQLPVTFPALFVRDFDGDGQNELALQWMNAGFARYEVYEWNNGALTYADAFDTQDDLLLRFNQNNVAAYSKDGRMMAVTLELAVLVSEPRRIGLGVLEVVGGMELHFGGLAAVHKIPGRSSPPTPNMPRAMAGPTASTT